MVVHKLSWFKSGNNFRTKHSVFEQGKGVTTLQVSALRAGIYFYTLICDGKPVDTK